MNRKVYIVGRTGDIKLHSKDDTASREHAELIIVEDKVYLTDLASKNGIFKLSERGQKSRFSEGWVSLEERFLFGDCALTVAEMLQQVGERMQNQGQGQPHSPNGDGNRAEPKPPPRVDSEAQDSKKSGKRIRCPYCATPQLSSRKHCKKCGEALAFR